MLVCREKESHALFITLSIRTKVNCSCNKILAIMKFAFGLFPVLGILKLKTTFKVNGTNPYYFTCNINSY